MPISIHVLSHADELGPVSEDAIAACFAELSEIDRVFSTYRDHSDIRRIARGELRLVDADPRVGEVEAACRSAAVQTRGLFSAMWRGWFDPTGYVKGWSVETAARRHLAPLLGRDRVAGTGIGPIAVGINAGGDMQLFTVRGTGWRWNVGIADPRRPGEIIASLQIENGAVATSGTAERGSHVIDPRTGEPARGVVSATVAADSLTHADLWATAAVIGGLDDRSWLPGVGESTGLLIADDGRVTRWLDGVSIDVVDEDDTWTGLSHGDRQPQQERRSF
ncbi:FAD:protein FMN transferase [Micromonospora sp. DT81.3]|uniref:FAD:protein FMN transferase n=1 Tax=Micromonospora sp. DT81.3 TaxID=3416523 RepID=UPI003CEEF871